MAGLKFQPSERWDLGLNLTWTSSDAALDPFDLSAPDYVATHASTAYDFSQSHTYSDLDTTRLDGGIEANYHLNKTLWIGAKYRYVDFSDDAPYLYDTSGTISFYQMVVGWVF